MGRARPPWCHGIDRAPTFIALSAQVREELYGCQIEDSKKESPAQLVLDLYMKVRLLF